MGTGGGGGGSVHSVVTGATVPAAGEDEGDRVREHVYQWDCDFGSCHNILLHHNNLGRRNRYPHTRRLIKRYKPTLSQAWLPSLLVISSLISCCWLLCFFALSFLLNLSGYSVLHGSGGKQC